jgi:hypothetical protein
MAPATIRGDMGPGKGSDSIDRRLSVAPMMNWTDDQ